MFPGSIPADYDNDLSRGTVDFDSTWLNYSFTKVNIPRNTIVEECNFTQVSPLTEAIHGDYEITFNACNMCNVALNSKWILNNCLTVQSWIIADPETGKESREFVCAHPNELTEEMKIPPDNAVLARTY